MAENRGELPRESPLLDSPPEADAREKGESGKPSAPTKTGEAAPPTANRDRDSDREASTDEELVGREKEERVKDKRAKKLMRKALYLCDEEEDDGEPEKLSFEGPTAERGGRAKWLERQRDREWKNKRLSKSKDGTFFSYMFLEKIFRESRRCKLCQAKGSGKPFTDDESSLELFVTEGGLCGRQQLQCTDCKGVFYITSCDSESEIPESPEYRIDGSTIRYYCKHLMHMNVVHDLMELLNISALDTEKSRTQKHTELAEFMLKNARKICREWCKPESSDLRYKRFLRLREETIVMRSRPTFTIDHNSEYREMYGMMAGSFKQHREKVKLLLELLKTTLFDDPTPSTFYLWVSIAMIHAECYQRFKERFNARSFMQVDSTEFQAFTDRYLGLHVALGVKKIPVCFVLFELPRFYHYLEFLKENVSGERPTKFLTEEDHRTLEKFDRQAHKYLSKRRAKSGKLMSMEPYLDLLDQKEEMDRATMFRNTREKALATKEERRRHMKEKRDERKRQKLLSMKLQEDTKSCGAGMVVAEISESLDSLERKRKERSDHRMAYPPFRQRMMGPMRDRTSFEGDMVAEMTLRKPYKSRFDLLLEEEDRQWGLEGNWSRKDILLCEEDMMFERRVCIRFKKPDKAFHDAVPSNMLLPHSSGRMPTQAEVLLLVDKLLKKAMEPVSFDGACSEVSQEQRERVKESDNWAEQLEKQLKKEEEKKKMEAQKKREEEAKRQRNEKKKKEEEERKMKKKKEKEAEKKKKIEAQKKKAAEKKNEEEKKKIEAEKKGEEANNKQKAESTVEEEAKMKSDQDLDKGKKEEDKSESEKAGEEGEGSGCVNRESVEEQEKIHTEVDSEKASEPVSVPEACEPSKTAEPDVETQGIESPKNENENVEQQLLTTESAEVSAKPELKLTEETTAVYPMATESGTVEEVEKDSAEIVKSTQQEQPASVGDSVEEGGRGQEERECVSNSAVEVQRESAEPPKAEQSQPSSKVTAPNSDERELENSGVQEPQQLQEQQQPVRKSTREEERERDRSMSDKLKRFLSTMEWDERPDTQKSLSEIRNSEMVVKSGRTSSASTKDFLEIVKEAKAAGDIPIRRVTISPEGGPPAVNNPESMSEKDKKMVEELAGLCSDYLKTLPNGQPGGSLGNPTAVMTHSNSNVMVAFVSTDATATNLPPEVANLFNSTVPPQTPSEGSSEPRAVKKSAQNEPGKAENRSKPTVSVTTAGGGIVNSESMVSVAKAATEKEGEEKEKKEVKKYDVKEHRDEGSGAKDEGEDAKQEKKFSKKKSKRMEKKAKKLIEAVQRRKAIEEKYFQHHLLRRTPSEEAFDKLMENKDRTLADLNPEERQVLMEYCHKRRRDPVEEEWDRAVFSGRRPQGPAMMRSRLRQKLYDRKFEDDPRSQKKGEKNERYRANRDHSPPNLKPKSKQGKSVERESSSGSSRGSGREVARPAVTDPETMAQVKERLDRIGKEASMPRTEPMKSKTTDSGKEESQPSPNPAPSNESQTVVKSSPIAVVTTPRKMDETMQDGRVMSRDQFNSRLVEHLRANQEAEERAMATISLTHTTAPESLHWKEVEPKESTSISSASAKLKDEENLIEQQPVDPGKASHQRNESTNLEMAGEEGRAAADTEEEEKREKKRQKKRANKLRKEDERQTAVAELERTKAEQERARLEVLEKTKAELEKVKAEQERELTDGAVREKPHSEVVKPQPPEEPKMVTHERKKPNNPAFNPQDYIDQGPLENLGVIPLMLTQAPVFITLDDMEDVERERENTSTSCFVYRISVENGGQDHPFRDIYWFADKRREDLDVIIEVSPIKCYRNHEDMLFLEGKPGRVSYSCKVEVSELRTLQGKDPMSVSLPIRPGYPTLSTLDSIFSQGSLSFTKITAELSKRSDRKPHTFDFGVSMYDPDFGMTGASRKTLSDFMETDPATVRRIMEREFARAKEKARMKEKRKKPPNVRKLVEKMKTTKSPADKVDSKAESGNASVKDRRESKPEPVVSTVPDKVSTDTTNTTFDAKSTKSRITARDKFRCCENCGQEISDRIQLCAGCKRVAYCNSQCQKAHWRQHKKSCSYVQKPASEPREKARVCGSCDRELSERVLLCAGCKGVAYCDPLCQKAHWKLHKKSCSYAKKNKDCESKS